MDRMVTAKINLRVTETENTGKNMLDGC